MPRHFFHVQDGDDVMRDVKGIDLPDRDAVREECSRIIVAVLAEPEFCGERTSGRSFRVEDESGRLVLLFPFDGSG
jgi:hypothetical protein